MCLYFTFTYVPILQRKFKQRISNVFSSVYQFIVLLTQFSLVCAFLEEFTLAICHYHYFCMKLISDLFYAPYDILAILKNIFYSYHDDYKGVMFPQTPQRIRLICKSYRVELTRDVRDC